MTRGAWFIAAVIAVTACAGPSAARSPAPSEARTYEAVAAPYPELRACTAALKAPAVARRRAAVLRYLQRRSSSPHSTVLLEGVDAEARAYGYALAEDGSAVLHLLSRWRPTKFVPAPEVERWVRENATALPELVTSTDSATGGRCYFVTVESGEGRGRFGLYSREPLRSEAVGSREHALLQALWPYFEATLAR